MIRSVRAFAAGWFLPTIVINLTGLQRPWGLSIIDAIVWMVLVVTVIARDDNVNQN